MRHLNLRDLKESDRKGNINEMKLDESQNDFECEICIRGKSTKSPFPAREERSLELLEIIYYYVCCPRVESIGKARYFVTFIDDFSGWCVVCFLKEKGKVK